MNRFDDQFMHGSFCWFTGVVEDRFDPEEMNRVRVRCFGYHSEDRAMIKTEDLPWATVMMPVTASGTSGIGDSPHGLMEGSWVVGFFRDGNSAQDPIIMGTIATKSSARDKSLGFTGNNYPKGEYVDQSDVNFSGRESTYKVGPSFQERGGDALLFPTIWTASPPRVSTVAPDKDDSYYERKTWTEKPPLNGHVPEYPYNKVNETESGHVFEVDDTPGSERTLRMHTSGSYEEIYNDGTRQVKIVGDDYEIILKDKNMRIKGNLNITVDGDMRQRVKGNYHLEVEGDYTENIKGSLQQSILGNHEFEIARNRSGNIGIDDTCLVNNNRTRNVVVDDLITVSGNHSNNTAGNMSLVAYGDTNVFSGGKYSQTCVSDHAIAVGGNAIFGVVGTLTETLDQSVTSTIGGTHTITSPTADITYNAGEITVATITHTGHKHTQPDTGADATTQGDTGSPKGST